MTNTGEISILAPGDTLGFRQMLAVYQEAIEPSEQKPADDIAQLVVDPRYVVIVSRSIGEVVGFAMLCFPTDQSFWLLEYMAVRQDQRSQGIGQRLVFAANEVATRRCPSAPCILEVDQPETAETPGNDPIRRLRLYRRLGFRRIAGLNYVLPLEAAGPPPPMFLLVHGMEGRSAIAKAVLREWLAAIYAQVYRASPNDARIAAMLSPLNDECFLSVI